MINKILIPRMQTEVSGEVYCKVSDFLYLARKAYDDKILFSKGSDGGGWTTSNKSLG